MFKLSILIVGLGALLVIVSLTIREPTSNEGYWTDEQQQSLDEARNRAHHLSDSHGNTQKEAQYQEALVGFEAEKEKLDAAKSRSVFFPRLIRWLGIGVATLGVASLAVFRKRRN